jgi:CrcB protein
VSADVARPARYRRGGSLRDVRVLLGDRMLAGAIALGGAIGAWARLGLAELWPARAGDWPWGTFAANLAGCALLGYASTRLMERLPPSTYRRPLVGTGLCGGLTTFSTLHLEVVELGRDGHALLAAAYLVATIAAGLLALALAVGLVRRARLVPA